MVKKKKTKVKQKESRERSHDRQNNVNGNNAQQSDTNQDQHDTSNILVDDDTLNTVKNWMAENSATLPEYIVKAIRNMIELLSIAKLKIEHRNNLLATLRMYMGITPKKERESLEDQDKSQSEWNSKTERKLSEKAKKAREELSEYKKLRPKKTKTGKKTNKSKLDDVSHPSSSPETQDDKPSSEPVFQAPVTEKIEQKEEIKVPELEIPNPVALGTKLIYSYDDRTRYDLKLIVTEITYNVETVTDPISGLSKTAKVTTGPAHYKITWNGIAQIVLFIGGLCLPINRLATALKATVGYFSASRIYRLFLYAAKAFAAVYFEIFKELSTCAYLSGDDTNNKVLKMNIDSPNLSEEEQKIRLAKIKESKDQTDPQQADFLLESEELLGGQSYRKNKSRQKTDDGGYEEKLTKKKAIYTSVIIGKHLKDYPDASLVFYYSERKTLGDLLGIIFKNNKEPNKKDVIIQTDLSSNNIPNPMPNNYNLSFAGCAAHARRPFWRYKDDENDEVVYYCCTLLLLFDQIFDYDRDARDTKDQQKIRISRQTKQKENWEKIKKHCLAMPDAIPPNHPLVTAANYIINHYEKLTKYLNDPNLMPDNNHAERLLRYEKSMLDNSKFRVSRKGRLAYDIIRTILTTCAVNKIDPSKYIVHILKNQMDVRENPEKYTPHAYLKSLKNS
jgi:hypothetical protein